MSTTIAISASQADRTLFHYNEVKLCIPERPLKNHALGVTTKQPKDYCSWSAAESAAVFEIFKEIGALWKEKGIGDQQYIVYGKQNLENNQPFSWQVVPYYKTSNFLTRIWQQIVVLWRIFFGGFTASKGYIKEQQDLYKNDFVNWISENQPVKAENQPGDDFLCTPEKFAKQEVFEGRHVRIVYNYAPIGFGGEPLHFLIAPKRHVPDFNDLTPEEYAEIADLSKRLITYFKKERGSTEVSLYRTFGTDAGQTVKHGHLHLIFTATKVQGIWGHLTVLKKMLFGSSPLPPDQLKAKVESLRAELSKANFGKVEKET